MGKRKYRAIWVKDADAAKLSEAITTEHVVICIDVAKEDFYAAVMDGSQRVHVTVKWKHPDQTLEFLTFARQLQAGAATVDVAMEPSGVYGDAVRCHLLNAGFEVYRVSPKRSHDMAEVYDGVPSWHDAKAAAIIGKLHLDGKSEHWPVASHHERRLTAALRVLEVHEKEVHRNRNRLEGHLARHWPELTRILTLGSATLLELLIAYGGPAQVAAEPNEARKLMRRVGGRFLAQEKIDAGVVSATSTLGMPAVDEERQMVMAIAGEARRQQKAAKAARRRVEQLSEAEESTHGCAHAQARTGPLVCRPRQPVRLDQAIRRHPLEPKTGHTLRRGRMTHRRSRPNRREVTM